jgi:hypothetical protein
MTNEAGSHFMSSIEVAFNESFHSAMAMVYAAWNTTGTVCDVISQHSMIGMTTVVGFETYHRNMKKIG